LNNRNKNFLIVMMLLLVFLLMMNSLGGPRTPSSDLPYSDVLLQVRQGQVKTIILEGYVIRGERHDGSRFTSLAPEDRNLVATLMKSGVTVHIRPDTGPPWYASLLLHWGPIILIIVIWVFLMRRMQGGNRLFSLGRSRARRLEEDAVRVTFSQVAGVEEAKEDLVEIIDFLKDPTRFKRLGGKIPKGVLMVGPPGTGKTLLAKAVAGEAGVPFFSISGSDFVEMFVGVGASRVRDLFEEGRKNAPCLLFIDEIDAVGRQRGAGLGSGHDEREQTLNQMLVEMDGFDTSDGVIVIAATNRPDVLDPALLRPGRFDRQVVVPLPDMRGREQILRIHGGKVKMSPDVNFQTISRGTPGFSGADLRNLVNEAALRAARNDKIQVDLSDLEWARDKVMMGPERRSMMMSDTERNNTAYHEAGHALVGALLPKADPVHKVTIIPRGMALGLTATLPQEELHNHDKEYLLTRIAVAMGGRAAEELVFNDVSTGAQGDIESATRIARQMVCQFGMSERLGPVMLSDGETQHFLGRDMGQEPQYSENTAEIIDEEVAGLVKGAYEKAKTLLAANRDMLERLAKMLLDQETVNAEEMKQLVQPQPA